ARRCGVNPQGLITLSIGQDHGRYPISAMVLSMSYINPLAGAYAQSGQVQRIATDDKDRQMRRAQVLRRNSAAPGDTFEHEVESSDAVILQSEEEHRDAQNKRKKRQPHDPPADAADGE